MCGHVKSVGENRIALWLQKNKIKFTQEQSFEKCIGKMGRRLRFDFYIPAYNMCIEYNGRQHYQEDSCFHHPTTVPNDRKKRRFCRASGIRLLVIPYTRQNNIEHILAKELLRHDKNPRTIRKKAKREKLFS